MNKRKHTAILHNLLSETLRVYEDEIGLPIAPSIRPSSPGIVRSRRRSAGLRGFGMADVKAENVILRHLLATTAEAYEGRLDAFRAEKGLVRYVLAATSDAVLTTDAHGEVTTLNPAAEELTGWSTAEARGQPLAEVLPLTGADGTTVTLDLASHFFQGCLAELQPSLLLRRRDGVERPVEGQAAAILGRHRDVLGAVLILRHDPLRS